MFGDLQAQFNRSVAFRAVDRFIRLVSNRGRRLLRPLVVRRDGGGGRGVGVRVVVCWGFVGHVPVGVVRRREAHALTLGHDGRVQLLSDLLQREAVQPAEDDQDHMQRHGDGCYDDAHDVAGGDRVTLRCRRRLASTVEIVRWSGGGCGRGRRACRARV